MSRGIYRLPRSRAPREGQVEAETRAARAPVGNFDRTAMLLDDSVRHRKAQPRALARRLGGEERIVDAVQMLGRDAAAGVGYLDLNTGTFRPRAHFEGAAGGH